MAVRLVIALTAPAGRGTDLAAAFKARCEEVMREPGCEQFEVFQSALDPDKLTLLELWTDEAALATHAKVNQTRAPLPSELRPTAVAREDYVYSRKR